MTTRSAVVLASLMLTVVAERALAQAENSPPRTFQDFAGTWTLDESAGDFRFAGLPVARTLVIAPTSTEIVVTKDSADPEIYRIDGTETRFAGSDRRLSFTLVAETLALTSRVTRQQRGHAFTNIITDAYAVAGDRLTIERQLSVLVQPPGNLATLSEPGNNRQTIVYRRK